MYQGALKPNGVKPLETGKNMYIFGLWRVYGEGLSTCLLVKIRRNLFSGRIWRSTKHKMVNFVLQVWSEATSSYFLIQYFFQKCAATLKREKLDFIYKFPITWFTSYVASTTACTGHRRQKWAKSLAVTAFTIAKSIQIILSSSCRQ